MLLPFSGASETLNLPVFEILEDAHDNLRVALQWWLDARRWTDGLALLRALAPLWLWVGIPPDGRRWMESMLAALPTEASTVPAALHAQVLTLAGSIAQSQTDYSAERAHLDASVALWRTVDDPVGLAFALCQLAAGYVAQDDFEMAEELLCESLGLARAGGDTFILAEALSGRGRLEYARGQYEQAAAHQQESLALGRTMMRPNYHIYTVIRSWCRLRAPSRSSVRLTVLAICWQRR
jgi:tetratricopeptide (TPR) repeat protein